MPDPTGRAGVAKVQDGPQIFEIWNKYKYWCETNMIPVKETNTAGGGRRPSWCQVLGGVVSGSVQVLSHKSHNLTNTLATTCRHITTNMKSWFETNTIATLRQIQMRSQLMWAREPRSDCSRQGHNNNTLAATCLPLYLHHLRTGRGKFLKPHDDTSYKMGHSVILSECNCPEMLKNQTQFHLNADTSTIIKVQISVAHCVKCISNPILVTSW